VTSSGRVLHTVNPRLFPDQLQYIMHHAEDAYVFFDPVFAPLVEQLAPKLPLAHTRWPGGPDGVPKAGMTRRGLAVTLVQSDLG
jgi:fatty-acyl-CoA synthase